MKPLYNFELIGSRSLRSMNSVFMNKNRVHRNTLIDKLAQSEGCGGGGTVDALLMWLAPQGLLITDRQKHSKHREDKITIQTI